MAEKKMKRERHANYSEEETRLLVDLVLVHKDVIESKVSDAVTWKEKNYAWETVASCFNARSSALVQRDSTNLKAKYEAIKKLLKKKVAKEKCDIYTTGGGSKVIVHYKDWEEKLLAILKLSMCGLPSAYDCDAPATVSLPFSSPNPTSVSSPQHNSYAALALPVSTPKPATVTSPQHDLYAAIALPVEDNVTSGNLCNSEMQVVSEVSSGISSKEKESDVTALATNSPLIKWDTWTPASLRTRKSLVLRKQNHRDLSKKNVLNEKYDCLADERKKLVAVQMELAKKELEVLLARAAHEEEVNELRKQQILRKMEQDEEQHKMKMELLKQQLTKNT